MWCANKLDYYQDVSTEDADCMYNAMIFLILQFPMLLTHNRLTMMLLSISVTSFALAKKIDYQTVTFQELVESQSVTLLLLLFVKVSTFM